MTGPSTAPFRMIRSRPWLRPAAACLFLAVPALAGGGTWGALAFATDYYGHDLSGLAREVGFRNRIVALVERASFLRSGSDAPPAYAWGAGAAGRSRRYLRNAAGTIDLDPIAADPRPDGTSIAAGVAENGLGTIVVAIAGSEGVWCEGIVRWMSPYTRRRASLAWLPGHGGDALPGAAEIDAASWSPASAPAACPAKRSAGALLLRFDGPAGT